MHKGRGAWVDLHPGRTKSWFCCGLSVNNVECCATDSHFLHIFLLQSQHFQERWSTVIALAIVCSSTATVVHFLGSDATKANWCSEVWKILREQSNFCECVQKAYIKKRIEDNQGSCVKHHARNCHNWQKMYFDTQDIYNAKLTPPHRQHPHV